jgi:N-acetylmuramoyl-L-alanine amidase
MIFRIASLVAEKAAAQFPNNKEKAETAAAWAGLAALVSMFLLLCLAVFALLYAGARVFEDANFKAKRQAIEASTKEISYQQARIPGLLADETAARTALEEASALASEALAKSARAQECLAANLGTGAYVDCSTMTGTLVVPLDKLSDADEKEAVSVVDAIFPKANAAAPRSGDPATEERSASETTSAEEASDRYLFVNWGHGLHENGKWADNGATAPDGTPERTLIMGMGDTVYNHALNNARLGETPLQVGRDRHTMKDNIAFASKHAKEVQCGDSLYRNAASSTCYMVSVHANLSDDVSKSGSVVYYNPYSERSIAFGQSVASCLGGRALSDEANRFGRLGILRDAENVEGILVEAGYMSNPEDLARMKSGKAGSDLAKCVVNFINAK